MDGVGNVFITDAANNNIVEVTPAGVQTTVVSGINSPGAVALDAAGDLFVTSGRRERAQGAGRRRRANCVGDRHKQP